MTLIRVPQISQSNCLSSMGVCDVGVSRTQFRKEQVHNSPIMSPEMNQTIRVFSHCIGLGGLI